RALMLHPLEDLLGFQIEATDGLIGHLVGVYFDDARWTVRYLVVKTSSHELALSPDVVSSSDARTRTFLVRMTKQEVEASPAIDHENPMVLELRRSQELIGYHLHALDGQSGHVDDLIIDDNWAIRYLAVDTSSWWFGAHVMIAPRWIRAVRWADHLVDLAVTTDVIEHSPRWRPGYPITSDYESDLLVYYQHRESWSGDARSNETPLVPAHPDLT
ncbi:MAG TPA: hypothetical protein VGC41_12100, partial [Kofleriaceae bacterium]